MFIIFFLFLVSPFYFYFFIFYGLTHHPPPATRHPLPATRHPPPVYPLAATRHPSPVTRGKVLPNRDSLTLVCLLLREPRFDGKQASCHSRSTNVLGKTKNNRTFKDFSMQQHLLIYPTYNYCIFI